MAFNTAPAEAAPITGPIPVWQIEQPDHHRGREGAGDLRTGVGQHLGEISGQHAECHRDGGI
jgi:hypothetical protein